MIEKFRGEYSFLSNFFKSFVLLDTILFPTVEHAYQAAKTLDLDKRFDMSNISSPGEAKRFGRALKIRGDWDFIKLDVMRDLVRCKFQYMPLREKLLNTGTKTLIEGNTHGDIYWGVCGGKGENMLGKILMIVRDEIRKDNNE